MNAKAYHNELETMVRTIDKLSRLEPVQLTTDASVTFNNDPERVDVEADEEWWEFWCEVCELVGDIGRVVDTEDEMYIDTPANERYMSIRTDGDYAIVRTRVNADGSISVMAEFEATDTDPVLYGELFDGFLHIDYDAATVGERVTEMFIGFLTTLGLSSAEALDYWATEIRNHSQYTWSKRRDTSRQAVSQNVAQATEKLEA